MADYPQALENDPDGVSTSLEVGANFWLRGDRDEALKWLRRAVDAAFDEGADARGLDLSKVAAALANATLAPPSPSKAPAVIAEVSPPAASPVIPVSTPAETPLAVSTPAETPLAVSTPAETPLAVSTPAETPLAVSTPAETPLAVSPAPQGAGDATATVSDAVAGRAEPAKRTATPAGPGMLTPFGHVPAPRVETPAPSPARPRAASKSLWNVTDAVRVAVSRAGGQVSLRTYDGGALRDGEVDAVIMGLSGGPELGDLLAPADEDTTAGAAR